MYFDLVFGRGPYVVNHNWSNSVIFTDSATLSISWTASGCPMGMGGWSSMIRLLETVDELIQDDTVMYPRVP